MADKTKKLKPQEALVALLKVAKQVYRAAPLAVIIKVISAIINAVLPIVIAYFAAQATSALADAYNGKYGAGSAALEYVIIVAALGLFSLVWTSAVRYIDEVASVKISTNLAEALMDHFTSLEFWRYEDKETADMYDKADSFTSYAARIFEDVTSIFTNLVQASISVVALTLVDWWYGVVLLAAVLPSAVVQWKISRLQTEYWHGNVAKRRTANDIRWNVFQPQNLAETRLYGAAPSLLKLYRELNNIDNVMRLRVERRYIAGRIATSILDAIGGLVVEVAVVLRIIGHAWPIGQYVYVQQLVSRTSSSVSALTSMYNNIDDQLAALYEYEKFMALPLAKTSGRELETFPNAIHFDNVSFTYPLSKRRVLKNIAFTIHKKQHVAIVGENGAGKSTLIKLLVGLFPPTGGEIMLDNVNLHEFTQASWHRHISVLMQDFLHYWFTTPLENVRYGDVSKKFDERRYREAVKKSGATAFIAKLSKKDNTLLNKWINHDDDTAGVELSGGQWQRLAVARNFYRDAELIVLDEPTSAIDAMAEAKIFDYLFTETEKTIVTISHRLSTVKKADVIYMMKNGSIVEQGTYSELMQAHGDFYTMFESQMT